MSDFIADLERELVAAARRRAVGRRRFVLVPRLRPATVLAFVALAALVVALVAVARGLDGSSHSGDERPSVPPGPGVALPLPAAETARACSGAKQRLQEGGAPQPRPLAVFTRPGADALPKVGDSFSWIPAGTIFLAGVRRAAPEQFDAQIYLVPIAEPRAGGGCGGELQAELGVCLVVAAGKTVVTCFSDAAVEAGRAVALTSPGVVHGIAPDGVGRVTVDTGREVVSADVHDNAYEIPAAVTAGAQIRLALERTEECRPSSELLEALPALRDGTWQTLPAPVEDAMPSAGVRQWTRRVETGGGLELWALAHCDGAESACVVAVADGNWVAQPCATAAEIRGHGTSWTVPVAGGIAVAGMAPPGTRSVQVVRGDRVHDLPLSGGVFGGLLPPAFGTSVDPGQGPPVEVRFR